MHMVMGVQVRGAAPEDFLETPGLGGDLCSHLQHCAGFPHATPVADKVSGPVKQRRDGADGQDGSPQCQVDVKPQAEAAHLPSQIPRARETGKIHHDGGAGDDPVPVPVKDAARHALGQIEVIGIDDEVLRHRLPPLRGQRKENTENLSEQS